MAAEYRDNPFLDEVWAGVYDASVSPDLGDVPMYLSLASERGGRVLELACGTGRIVLPLARAGHAVTGVDGSAAMLAVARRKVAAEPEAVRARIRLIEADLREVHLRERYGLAILAANSLIMPLSPDEQRRVFAEVRRHLAPGGGFVVDVFVPDPAILAQAPGTVTQDRTYPWPERGAVVRETGVVVATDAAAQTREEERRFEIRWPDGSVASHAIRWRLRLVYPQELLYLFEVAGFRIGARYGGWAREPFGPGARRMIVVGERAR